MLKRRMNDLLIHLKLDARANFSFERQPSTTANQNDNASGRHILDTSKSLQKFNNYLLSPSRKK